MDSNITDDKSSGSARINKCFMHELSIFYSDPLPCSQLLLLVIMTGLINNREVGAAVYNGSKNWKTLTRPSIVYGVFCMT